MNWKRAVTAGIILWVAILIEVSILMFGFGLASQSYNYYIIHYILLTILSILAIIFYFDGKKIKTGLKEGFFAGITMLVTAVILDSLITVPLFMKLDYSFLYRIDIVLGEIWAIILAIIIGGIKK